MMSRTLAFVLSLAVFTAVGCASNRIGDPNAYQPAQLNRVFPYPSEDELAGQKIEVVLAAQYSEELPKKRVGSAMRPVLTTLETYLSEAGAGVIDRSIHDLDSVRDELEAAETGTGSGSYTGADWAIVARVDRFRHWSEYARPSSWFRSEEQLAGDPGECSHYGEVEVLLRAFEVPTDDVARATYRLEHGGVLETKDYDPGCPIDATRELIFLESLVQEALPCLEAPIKNGFAPIGYIEEYRTGADAKTHIYRTSLGGRNGAKPGLELGVYRVQHMTTRDEQAARHEQRIGRARVSEQISDGYSWIVVDPSEFTQPILAGDLVRATYDDPQASLLGFGICEDALSVRGEP